ncbi:hypothetical protein BJX66DRAFT_308193, partial [Aspergillus keveii]
MAQGAGLAGVSSAGLLVEIKLMLLRTAVSPGLTSSTFLDCPAFIRGFRSCYRSCRASCESSPWRHFYSVVEKRTGPGRYKLAWPLLLYEVLSPTEEEGAIPRRTCLICTESETYRGKERPSL